MEKIDRLNRTYINISFLILMGINVMAGQMYVPISVQLGINAIFSIYIGSWFGIQINLKKNYGSESEQSDENNNAENMTMKDAAMFPIYGSAVLLSLYLVFKVIDKMILTYAFSVYFSFAGVLCTMQIFEYFLIDYFTGYDKVILFHCKINFIGLDLKFSKMDVVTLIFAFPIALYYGITRYWFLNNFFGIIFSVIGIQSLNLPNYKTAFILLWGLFFYDIFWVYGTDVMLTVAKSVDAPIKLMFPIDLTADPPKFSMLGLGDIVIPGIFVALCVRYDINRVLKKRTKNTPLTTFDVALIRLPYFNWCMVSYAIGLVITFAVMVFTKQAQPALLFLVPCVCLSVVIVSLIEGDFYNMLNYDENVQEKAEKSN